MSDFIAKTFRENPPIQSLPESYQPATRSLGTPAVLVTPHPKRVPHPNPEVPVGRLRAQALMGPTNVAAHVVLELWPNGTVTWRDG